MYCFDHTDYTKKNGTDAHFIPEAEKNRKDTEDGDDIGCKFIDKRVWFMIGSGC